MQFDSTSKNQCTTVFSAKTFVSNSGESMLQKISKQFKGKTAIMTLVATSFS